MKTTVCFTAKNIYYLKGGGHFWVPLNWSLGLQALGCDVIWLEPIDPSTPVEEVRRLTEQLKERLAPYGLRDCVALSSITEAALDPAAVEGCLDIAAASELAGLLVNLRYDLPADQVRRFRRSALLDIDPAYCKCGSRSGGTPPHHTIFISRSVKPSEPLLPGSHHSVSSGPIRHRRFICRHGQLPWHQHRLRIRPLLIGGAKRSTSTGRR